MSTRLLVVLATTLFAVPAFAAADLTASITAPASVAVDAAGRYQVTVRNIGNKTASNVAVAVTLPATHTSPTVYVLGDLGARDSRCTVSGTQLNCALGRLAKSRLTTVFFDIALPQSSAPLVFGAQASTTSSENSTSNNGASLTASVVYPALSVAAGAAAVNEHCTGTALTAFFECELFPSSISAHDTVFQAGGVLTFVGVAASYTGTWSQPSANSLIFTYFDGGLPVASFVGNAVDSDCFEGLTTFAGSTWVSPYSVCLQ